MGACLNAARGPLIPVEWLGCKFVALKIAPLRCSFLSLICHSFGPRLSFVCRSFVTRLPPPLSPFFCFSFPPSAFPNRAHTGSTSLLFRLPIRSMGATEEAR